MFHCRWCTARVEVWGSPRNVVRRHTLCFSEVITSTHSSLEVSQGMSPAGTLEVSVRSILRHSQSLRLLRECRSLAHLMVPRGQCFGTVKVEVPQRSSFTGTFDVSARSMLRHSQGLRFLRECRFPAHLMFQRCQCFVIVKVWGSSGNVAHQHTWCFS